MGRVTRVVIVDDSALIRQVLSAILNADPELEVVATAHDPYDAREKIKQLNPDVVTLDVEMPRMDGLSFLEKIMRLRPMPVVMVSSLTQEGADVTLRALELGAVDFVAKPTMNLESGMKDLGRDIIQKVKIAARTQVQALSGFAHHQGDGGSAAQIHFQSTEKVIAIGASTGGVLAIREVLTAMSADCPAILITQHMPAEFTQRFAARLNLQCDLTVEEAVDGQRVLPGHVYVAPGHAHLMLARSGANYLVRVSDDSGPVSGHMPSVDVLFDSVARAAGANAVGVIMTGMGKDGARGLVSIREQGGRTIGQNESSCTVYGMPRAAMEAGGVEQEVNLNKIAATIVDVCGDRHVRI